MAKEILITGMEGMAGFHLAKVAVEAKLVVSGTHHPEANTNNIDALIRSGSLSAYSCDLTKSSDVKNLFAGILPDIVFHLAGKANNPQSWSDDTLQVNVAMCQNLLQELQRRSHTPRVVFASTVNVYGGLSSERPFSENDPVNPNTPYALSKDVQEKLLDLYSRRLGLEVVVARSSQHTGSGRAPGFVEYQIGQQILRIEKAETPTPILLRNAAAEVDLLDVRDVVSAYLLLAQKGNHGEAYNIASGTGVSVRKVAELMVAVSRIKDKGNIVISSTGEEKPSPARYANRKITVLGWKPIFTLPETLKYFLDSMRQE